MNFPKVGMGIFGLAEVVNLGQQHGRLSRAEVWDGMSIAMPRVPHVLIAIEIF
jgi:hypothetical protein